uniref:Uncharacterized protein n=1 Tax=Siphoviridae sp. ctdj515 TaxID=2825582 RepID=A0A8S5UEB5_9CAUD|nr:MAG TPA: hypothetical protein [Siphoviridae sp. ctdj515]
MTRAGAVPRVRLTSASCALGAGGDCRLSCARCRHSSTS